MHIALVSVSNFMQVHEGRSELLGLFHLGNEKYETLSLQKYLTPFVKEEPPFLPSLHELSTSELNEHGLMKWDANFQPPGNGSKYFLCSNS